jgi:hypothetical protein
MTIGNSNRFEGSVKPSSIEVDGYEPDLFAQRYTEIPSNMQMRADYGSSTDGLPDYVGYAPKGLSSSSDGWLLQKFTYDANRQCTLRQIAYDSWDSHSSTANYS